MKLAILILACLACPGFIQTAQASSIEESDAPSSPVSTEASASEPSGTETKTNTAPTANELKQALDRAQQILQQQADAIQMLHKEVEKQGKEIDELRHLGVSPTAEASQLQSAATALKPAPAITSAIVATPKTAARPSSPVNNQTPAELFFRIGNATFTPGGYVDFTGYYRSTNVGSGLGTSFASIPFKNTVQAGSSEARITAQASRLSIRVDERIRKTSVYGYAEADFNGYLPGNAYVSTNSNTLRMRVYYLNLARGKWEILGGQGWSLLTPNRKALSPFLADIFNTFHLDTNYQVGLVYARQAQFRTIFHPTPTWAMGLSIENAEQYAGSAVTFPSLYSTTQVDVNSSTGSGGGTNTPNLHPDVVFKTTLDRKIKGLVWHAGVAGLLTSARTYTPASVTKGKDARDGREGGAIMGNINLELFKGFHLIGLSYWSDGGGRYIGGLGPNFVVLQKNAATAPFSTAVIHSGSGIGGFEWQLNARNSVSAYYGGAYYQRRYALDPTVKTPTYVGYGYPGSPNTQNRALQEGSFATNTILWKDTNCGALQFITQFSYATRAPWYVAPGSPKNAHTFMGFTSIRYVLP